MGEVDVEDLTLDQAKERIVALVRRKVRSAAITVTLTKPRMVVVHVHGQVLHPGSYILSAADRVDQAIEEANKQVRGEPAADREAFLAQMATRSIVVAHTNGIRVRADLPMHFASRADSLNPFLRGGDVITVPRWEKRTWVFAIYGEVHNPGRFEYLDGDSLLQALRMAQGWTPRARADSAELHRLGPSGTSMAMQIVDLEALAGAAQYCASARGSNCGAAS